MAVGIIIHLVIQKWESLTHGHIGVVGIPGPGPIGPIIFDSAIARPYLPLLFFSLAGFCFAHTWRRPLVWSAHRAAARGWGCAKASRSRRRSVSTSWRPSDWHS